MARIFIIDDSDSTCEFLSEFMYSLGHQSAYSLSLSEGLKRLSEETFDIVILDVGLPDGNGLEALGRIRSARGNPEVIIITGYGTPDGAQIAIEHGAWDYLEKPLSGSRVRLAIKRALDYREGKANRYKPVVLKRDRIIGSSPLISKCLEQVAVAARSMAVVLITGETGTGKELFAKAIHENSPRAERPFVVVDCAALPESLVETILFGHVKGAFTGADREMPGLVRQANGGTLFLDEIGELPLGIQGVLLRVLQEGRFRAVGGDREQASDFRLIAATNRDLDSMVQEGSFRLDLLFRLKSILINIPALRHRGSDLVEIALFVISELAKKYGTGFKGMSPEFLEALLGHSWPGNVRELIHVLESSFSAAHEEPVLHSFHLPLEMRIKLARASVNRKGTEGPALKAPESPKGALPAFSDYIFSAERQYLVEALKCAGGDIAELCKITGISRANLYAKLKKHGLKKEYPNKMH